MFAFSCSSPAQAAGGLLLPTSTLSTELPLHALPPSAGIAVGCSGHSSLIQLHSGLPFMLSTVRRTQRYRDAGTTFSWLCCRSRCSRCGSWWTSSGRCVILLWPALSSGAESRTSGIPEVLQPRENLNRQAVKLVAGEHQLAQGCLQEQLWGQCCQVLPLTADNELPSRPHLPDTHTHTRRSSRGEWMHMLGCCEVLQQGLLASKYALWGP